MFKDEQNDPYEDHSEHEWQTFVSLAERLEIPLRELLQEDVRFSDMELAGHKLGRAVAQITTERLAFARAERMTGPQPCPVCGRQCPLVHEERELKTIDGPVELVRSHQSHDLCGDFKWNETILAGSLFGGGLP